MSYAWGSKAKPVKGLPKKLSPASLAAIAVLGFSLATPAHATQINCNGRLVTQLDFSNPVLQSGTALQTNAVYQFTNVAPGIDAQVQVLGFTGGATLNFVDRDTGLIDNFQPELNASQTSSADFRISFFAAGTSTPIEVDFSASGIDIDGNSANPTGGTLREYAEFETTLVESVQSNPTELDTNASGPSAADRIRFESSTFQFAPGIDETATANIVTTFYTDTSSFEYRIGALGTGTQTRLTSLGFNCPNLQSPITSSEIDEDFGDAPLSYGNPIHTLINGIRLGTTNTNDTGPFDSSTASGDAGDDGITIPTLTENQSAIITANVSGNGGFLQGWIDWNGDGDFDDSGERVATDLQDTNSNGTIDIPVTVPNDPTSNATFARFRWSTTAGIASNTAVGDGEVEDYQIPAINIIDLSAVKTVEVLDTSNEGLYMTPGNSVVYKITVNNSPTSNVPASDIALTDTLPSNVTFLSAAATGFTGGAFISPPPTNMDCLNGACVINFEGASLAVDTIGEVAITALIK